MRKRNRRTPATAPPTPFAWVTIAAGTAASLAGCAPTSGAAMAERHAGVVPIPATSAPPESEPSTSTSTPTSTMEATTTTEAPPEPTTTTSPPDRAPITAAAVAPPVTFPLDEDRASILACIRSWEQGIDGYATNTGNGYYGAYQFDLPTWGGEAAGGPPGSTGAVERAGYPEYARFAPSDAPAHVQDAAAWRLYQERRYGPWPTPAVMCP